MKKKVSKIEAIVMEPKTPSITVKQEMYNGGWSHSFLKAFDEFTDSVRKGKSIPPSVSFDYGLSGANPYGVGASSLTKDVRNWWYGRKGYPRAETPYDYHFTAEQGRMMEIPAQMALQQMGYKVTPQVECKGNGSGGISDGVISSGNNQDIHIVEYKHLNSNRYLNMFFKPLSEADVGYLWQAAVYQNSDIDLDSTLFVCISQDASAVRAKLYKYKEGPKPNPKVFAFRLYRNKEMAEHIQLRADGMMATLKSDVPPAREADILRDWICQPSFCEFRDQCLQQGKDGAAVYQLPQINVVQSYLD